MSLFIVVVVIIITTTINIILVIIIGVVMLKLSRVCDDVRAVSMFIRSVYHNKIAKGCKVNYTNRIQLILFHLRVCVVVCYFAHACIFPAIYLSHKYVHSNTYIKFKSCMQSNTLWFHAIFFLSHSPLSLTLSLFWASISLTSSTMCNFLWNWVLWCVFGLLSCSYSVDRQTFNVLNCLW